MNVLTVVQLLYPQARPDSFQAVCKEGKFEIVKWELPGEPPSPEDLEVLWNECNRRRAEQQTFDPRRALAMFWGRLPTDIQTRFYDKYVLLEHALANNPNLVPGLLEQIEIPEEMPGLREEVAALVSQLRRGIVEKPMPIDSLECVIVCVNYAEQLALTLPRNKPLLDKIVVVTTAADKATHKVCAENKVKRVLTTRLHENGDAFNKGKAINDGLGVLTRAGWVLQLDADVLLPSDFRATLNRTGLDRQIFYGAKRVIVTPEQLDTPIAELKVVPEGNYFGFFQLFRGEHTLYPEDSPNAAGSDVVFARQFPVKKILYTLPVRHIGETGKNWNGVQPS